MIAIAVLVGLSIGAYYVSIILEPFLLPLFWAGLTGFVLHPYKVSLSEKTRDVLQTFNSSDSPVVLTCLRLVGGAVVDLCDVIGNFVFTKVKIFLGVICLITGFFFLVRSKSEILLNTFLGLWDFVVNSNLVINISLCYYYKLILVF